MTNWTQTKVEIIPPTDAQLDAAEVHNSDTMSVSEDIDENLAILRDASGKIVGMALRNWSKIRR